MMKARLIGAALVALLGCSLLDARQIIIRNANDCDNVPSPCNVNPIAASRLPAGNTSLPQSVWAMAGKSGGVPGANGVSLRSTCTTLGTSGQASTFTQSVTVTDIQNALNACTSGQRVVLETGTYNLSTGIAFSKDNVTLAGEGANNTLLNFSGSISGCQSGYNGAIRMCKGSVGNIGCTTACGGPGPDHSANWTASYSQGSTTITLASVTGLAVGSIIFLDQNNDSSDGYPAAGDLYVCDDNAPCSREGGNALARDGRVQVELHEVTAINGTNVTIEPGVIAPNFRSGQDPEAWWADTGDVLEGSGVEDLSIDSTGASTAAAIIMVNAKNLYVRGVRTVNTTGDSGSFLFGIAPINAYRTTIRDSMLYGPQACSTNCNTKYAYSPHVSSLLLFENMILHGNVAPTAPNDPETGSVYGYVYVNGARFANPGFQPHGAGEMYNLVEGTDQGAYNSDNIHGTHFFVTIHRNAFSRLTNNSGCSNSCAGLGLDTVSRFFNVTGNAFDNASWTTYEGDGTGGNTVIYRLGDDEDGTIADDPRVKLTLFRWGNYDSVNAAIRWNTGEVPSGITNYSNPVPSAQTVPTSFYLSAKPSWFGSVAYPPIGPDVTGGNVSGFGGHVNKIPARVCFESLSNDGAYSGTSPQVKVFNAVTCYGS